MTSSSRGGDVWSGGVRSHSPSSPLAVARDPEVLLRTVLGGVVRFDEPVALQPLQRRVHLADVQRPHLAGSRFELLAEQQAVLGSLAQEREEGVPDTHGVTALSSIRSILLDRPARCQVMIGVPAQRRRERPAPWVSRKRDDRSAQLPPTATYESERRPRLDAVSVPFQAIPRLVSLGQMAWTKDSLMSRLGVAGGHVGATHTLTEEKQGTFHFTMGPYSLPALHIQPGDRVVGGDA